MTLLVIRLSLSKKIGKKESQYAFLVSSAPRRIAPDGMYSIPSSFMGFSWPFGITGFFTMDTHFELDST